MRVETSLKVYLVLLTVHENELKVLKSYTTDDRAETTWGFVENGVAYPIMSAESVYGVDDDGNIDRSLGVHRYWLHAEVGVE